MGKAGSIDDRSPDRAIGLRRRRADGDIRGRNPAFRFRIGDEIRDIEAARKAGIAFGAVTWGYATAQALQAQAPEMIFSSMNDMIVQLAA